MGDQSSENLASDSIRVEILADSTNGSMVMESCEPAKHVEPEVFERRKVVVTPFAPTLLSQMKLDSSSNTEMPDTVQKGQHHSRKRKATNWLNHINSLKSSDTNALEACSQPKVKASQPSVVSADSSMSHDSYPFARLQRRARNETVRQLNGTPNSGASDNTNSAKAYSQPELSAFQPLVASSPARTTAESKPLSRSQRHRRNRALKWLINGTTNIGTSNNTNLIQGCSQPQLSALRQSVAFVSSSSMFV